MQKTKKILNINKPKWEAYKDRVKKLAAVAVVVAGSMAFGGAYGSTNDVLRAIKVPPTAVKSTVSLNMHQTNKIIEFFTTPYCNVVLNPSIELKGMFVVRSNSLDPISVGWAFLREAAYQRGVNLNWFDMRFLDKLAYNVGEYILAKRPNSAKFSLNQFTTR